MQHPYIHLPLFLLRENSENPGDFLAVGCSVHSVEEAKEATETRSNLSDSRAYLHYRLQERPAARGLDFLREICNAVTIPVYAIGGIHAGTRQIQEVMDCGALRRLHHVGDDENLIEYD